MRGLLFSPAPSKTPYGSLWFGCPAGKRAQGLNAKKTISLRNRFLEVLRGILCLSGLLLVVVTFTPLTLWWGRALSGTWTEDAGDAGDVLIILGADDPTAGIIGRASYWRTVYAARAWESVRFKLVVVSGGNGVAESIRELLVCRGVPAGSIQAETRSTSTRENALFTRDLVAHHEGRKVLLTSDYHMYRASRAFQKAGVDVIPRPLPDVLKHANRWENRWNMFLVLVVETGKIAGYWMKGWI
jgi:uncharacterized SAM-binding protein YcdF (DUF218 family)